MKVKLKIDRKKKARPAEKKSVIRKTAGTDSSQASVPSGASNRFSDGHKNPRVDERNSIIEDLRETVAILQMKVQKLEQLLRLKDKKIDQLQGQLTQTNR
mmetsp:Transcript_35288/g.65380  ORF Transcript_35288/g.65380 Transcript_35288/m.65380 type:complete len:100 (-) Transcript_35288:354-653(-)